MKKNYLFGLLSLFTVLFAASCQEEELVDAQANTDVVTFNVNTELVGTRAADTGEGALATKLYYGVYEYVNDAWSLVPTISKTSEPVNLPKEGTVVNIRLAKQKKYSVIFWAQSEAENKLCTVNWAERKLQINNALANQESYDAFWGYDEVTLTGALKREKLLVRPFAQLNIGVSDADWNAAVAASVELQNSAVTVKKVPTTMSLVDGTVGAFTDASSVAYTSAAIPSSTDWTFPVDGNKYLALNYVLVGDEKSSLIDVELSYTDKENGSYSSTFTDVPVRRNYRTNIYGNLLTSDADYSVKIEAGIAGDNNVDDNNDGIARSSVATVEELQEAINNAKAGETNIISFENDINGATTRATSAATIIVPQTEGVNIVVDGRGYKFDGTFDIYGHARNNGAETLKFTNINFEHTDGAIDFISCNTTEPEKRYAHNVTVENCTFTGNSNGDVVGMRYRQCYNITVLNCTATNMHSLMWATGTTGITLDGVTVSDSKSGVSFGTSNNVVVKNSNITASEAYAHGIRVDASGAYKLSVENNTIKADAPILLRKATGAYSLSLSNNTLTTTKDYQLIICNNDDYAEGKDLVEPTGAYTVSGLTKGTKMFPVTEKLHEESGLYYNGNDNAWKSVFYLYDAEDLVKAVEYFVQQTHTSEANGVTFELKNDIDLAGRTWTPWSVMWITLNGNNHTISNINVTEGWRAGLFGYLGAAKVNDLVLENVTVAGAQVGILAGSVEGVTTNNVTIKGNNSVSYTPYKSTEYTETWGGLGAVTGVVANSTINATIAEGATVVLNDNGIVTEATFMNFLSGYLQENKGTIVNNGAVSAKISTKIEANSTGTGYNGDLFEPGATDLFVLQGSELTGDAQIVIKRTYRTVALENVTARVNDNLIIAETDNTIILHDCNITLPEGKKLIVTVEGVTVGQVMIHNVKVNGELLTKDTAKDYMQGVNWYEVW